MSRLNRYAHIAVLAVFVAVLLTLVPAGDEGLAQDTSATETEDWLDDLNALHALSFASWQAQYNRLRLEAGFRWMDWSQDACSTPKFVPNWYNDDFNGGCLRHDLMRRSLAVADAGTGRVWNERNRLVADRGFRADNYAACAGLYETLIERPLLTACNLAAPGYFMAVQSKYEDSNDTEERSVDLDPQFLEYPSSGTVDCGPITGRCLPVHYLEVDGRPFAPQNLPFVVTNRTIALNVVRAHLQYAKGPPTNDTSATNWNSEWRSTGELLLRVNYPLRVSHSSVIACLTETNPKPNPQTLAISHTNWPVPTRDSGRKTTRIYVKACAATATGGEAETLMELYPRQARYQWRVTNPEYREGGRARHYLNFRTQACGTGCG